jgi:hypothetical protein
MAGRTVRSITNVTSERVAIDASDLLNGIYLYRIEQNGAMISTGKMIVNH